MKKKIVGILIFLISISGFSNERYSSYLLGDKNGKVYYEENADEVHPLASVTKMVNLMVIFDKIENGEISVTDLVTISEKARNIKGSRIWIGRGSKVSVEDLIKATAIHSANNAAYALAEYASGGDVDKFIDLMNKKAVEAGAGKEVEFYTPTGLPPYMTGKKMDIGTARGIYLLSMKALEYPEYIKIASMEEATIQGTQKIKNRNKLISKETGIYGIKTGHHGTAGYNISIVSKRNDNTAITVVFGSPTEDMRNKVSMEIIDEFYREYQIRKIADKNKVLDTLIVEKGVKENIDIYIERDVSMFVSDRWDISVEANYNERIIAPIKKGDLLGDYRVLVEGELIDKGNIYADINIPKENIIKEVFKDIFRKEKSKTN